ncbi:MAG: hypothetical protein CMJ18_00475 [Phycisphaeraceae bacterium]|nr:hypothetical protein [Phycisphaeraceae bacterium]
MDLQHLRCIAAYGLAIALGSLVCAAPMVPRPIVADDSVGTLAKLKALNVMVRKLPEELRARGVTVDSVSSQMKRGVRDLGLGLSDDERAPSVECRIMTVADPTAPGPVAYTVTLLLRQPIKVKRLDREFFAPTYVMSSVGLEQPEKLADDVAHTLDDTLRKLIRRIDQASRAWEGS